MYNGYVSTFVSTFHDIKHLQELFLSYIQNKIAVCGGSPSHVFYNMLQALCYINKIMQQHEQIWWEVGIKLRRE